MKNHYHHVQISHGISYNYLLFSRYNNKLTLLALPSVIYEPRFRGSIRNLVYSDQPNVPPRRQEMRQPKDIKVCKHNPFKLFIDSSLHTTHRLGIETVSKKNEWKTHFTPILACSMWKFVKMIFSKIKSFGKTKQCQFSVWNLWGSTFQPLPTLNGNATDVDFMKFARKSNCVLKIYNPLECFSSL